jgi:hypothetical protein
MTNPIVTKFLTFVAKNAARSPLASAIVLWIVIKLD